MSAPDTEHAWVLYVDPDGTKRERVVESFASEGIATEAVRTAEAARQVLSARRPSCVVSEFDLAETDGIALLESIREVDGELPFVLFTDEGDEQVASDAVTAGVSEYLRKTPTDPQRELLVERVTALLSDDRGQVSEDLKDRAMDRAPVGITIADVQRPDEPLIYVNDAFEQLTGYPAEETLGRNCRFLQGERTDPETVGEMRAAIENDEATAVELRNYTKAGEEFWNRVEIAPVRTVDGETTHYVGYQTDVSARKQAELTARKRADALERKQADLEALLSRIEGLLRDVSEAVIHARTTADIEQHVCEALVDADEYTLAWVGERGPGTESVGIETCVPEEASGRVDPDGELVRTALDEDVVAFDVERPDRAAFTLDTPADGISGPGREPDDVGRWLGEPPDGATDAATRDGDPAEGEHTEDESAGGGRAGREGNSQRAAVPLTYRNTTYGVLGIHADADHTFDGHEAVVLSTLGRIVATAMNALRSQSLLQGEAVIELELSVGQGESFVGVSAACDCQLDHVGTIPPGDEPGMTLFFAVSDASPEDVAGAARQRDGIEAATVVRTGESGDRGVLRLSIGDSVLVDALVEYGGTVVDATANGDTGTVTLQLPKDADPRTFVDEVESRVPGGALEAYREDERPGRTNQEFVSDVEATLTDRQRETLRTAYASGFFEWPRKASGSEVSEAMNISRSTFHQHLRFAERKLLDRFYRQ